MAFFNGCDIDIKTITELAAEGLSLNSMSKMTGHSKNGIKGALDRNNIPYTMGVKERFITVDGVLTSLGDACNAQGFSREAMYAWRVKRGLNEQDGFNAYVEYQKTKTTKHPVLTVDTCIVKYKKETYSLKSVCKMLGLHVKSVDTYMRQNKYTQASFDRLCYAKGKL